MAQLLRLAYYDSGTSQDLAMLFISFRATVRYQYFNGLDVTLAIVTSVIRLNHKFIRVQIKQQHECARFWFGSLNQTGAM